MTVSTASILCMAISAVFCSVIPFVIMAVIRRKTKAGFVPFFIGFAVFTIFALVLESIMHNIVLLGRYGDTIQNNICLYALYGGLAAGIFEETGRFIAFKTVMRKSTDRADSLMYGAGHGGIESIFVAGMGMVSNIVLSLMMNLGLTDTLTAAATDEATLEAINAQLASLATTKPEMFLLGSVERCSAIALHIALSVLVYAAAKNGKRFWLYPAAVLLHAAADGVLVVLANGLGLNVYLVEAILAVMTAAIVIIAAKVYRSMKSSDSVTTESNIIQA